MIDALQVNGDAETQASEREVIDQLLNRAVVGPDSVSIQLKTIDAEEGEERGAMELILIPFAPPVVSRKGVAHAPALNETLSDASRVALLNAIARGKGWVESALKDPAFELAAIAAQEKLSERYIRLLMPLAFVSPRVIDVIADGEALADLTPTALSRNLPLV